MNFSSTLNWTNVTIGVDTIGYWQDNTYPFAFSYKNNSGALNAAWGNMSAGNNIWTQSLYGMVNYTETNSSYYFSQVTGTFGNPTGIYAQLYNNNQSWTNFTASSQCCIPS